jgi:hypothetical protein
MDLESLRNEYFELVKQREVSTQTLLTLKDYNTSLRLAIMAIPDNKEGSPKKNKNEEKKKDKQTLAINKAKMLANKGEISASIITPEKKRKAEGETPDVPRVKRAYKKRATLAEKQKAKDEETRRVLPEYNELRGIAPLPRNTTSTHSSVEQEYSDTEEKREIEDNKQSSESERERDDDATDSGNDLHNYYEPVFIPPWGMETDPMVTEVTEKTSMTITETF